MARWQTTTIVSKFSSMGGVRKGLGLDLLPTAQLVEQVVTVGIGWSDPFQLNLVWRVFGKVNTEGSQGCRPSFLGQKEDRGNTWYYATNQMKPLPSMVVEEISLGGKEAEASGCPRE